MLKKRLMSSAQSKGYYYTYNIMLGSACNWHCPYCIQTEKQYKQADPDIFCDHLLAYLTKTQRLDKLNTFCLWGGEPLLYYDAVRTLLSRLSKLQLRDYIRISSNGSLLTEDNYHIFNKYPVKFEISYHEGQLASDKWAIALKIQRLTVSSLISHKILDWSYYQEKWQRLCERFGRYIRWYIFPIIYAGNASRDYAMTKDDIDHYILSLYKHLDKDLDNVFYKTAFEGLIYDASAKGMQKYTNYCYNDQSIAIDLYGNRYSCHHDYSNAFVVGNIFSTIPIAYTVANHSDCKNCRAYPICVGGCFRCKDIFSQCYYYQKLWDLLQVIKNKYKSHFNEEYVGLIP